MARESHDFGGLELNDNISYGVLAHTFKPAQETPDLVGGPDSEGAVLARQPRPAPLAHEIVVRIKQQATWDAAGALVAAIVQRAAECARRPDGLPHVWTPQDASTGFTAYVLHAQIIDVPITQENGRETWGWLDRSPVVKIALLAKPYWYLDEVEGTPVTSSDPLVIVDIADVAGDVEAEGRIIVTDAAAQARRHAEWFLESRFLDPALSYVVPASDLVTTGYVGTHDTRSGAIDGDVVTAIVRPGRLGVTALCELPTLAHVGRFKVRARIWCDDDNVRLRLLYRSGDRALQPTAAGYVSPSERGFAEIDFGEVVLRPAILGTQEWAGRFDAYNDVELCRVEIDEVYVLPVERYGLARAHWTHDTGVIFARDILTQNTGPLDDKVAEDGGSWDSSGSVGDFDVTAAAAERDTVSDLSPRIAVLPASTDDVEVGVAYGILEDPGTPSQHGVVARYTDASNYLRLTHQLSLDTEEIWVEKVIGGTPEIIAQMDGLMVVNTLHVLRLTVYSTGLGIATWIALGGAILNQTLFFDDDLAAGGALESGDVGILDYNGSSLAGTRYYVGFVASTPAPEPVVIHPSRSLEFRHDAVLRESQGGGAWGEPWYRGDRVLIPPAGYMNRDTRIAVKVRKDDVDATGNTETGASTIVQVNYAARFRMPART